MMSKTVQPDTPIKKLFKANHSKSIRQSSNHPSSIYSQKNSSVHSRIRKASAHEFVREIKEFEASQVGKDRRLKTLQTLQTLQSDLNYKLLENQNDIFLQSKIHDELETKFQRLSKENEPMNQQQKQQLQYVTFRILKKDQKSHLVQLRQKLMPKKVKNKS